MDVAQQPLTETEAAAAPITALTGKERRTILIYSSVIAGVLNFVSPSVGIFVIPLAFILKNKLHLSASELAMFGVWAGMSAYFSFLFGVVRDRWNPLGLGDRGYFILFGGVSAITYVAFCFPRASEPVLLANAVIEVIAFLFSWAAWNGIATTLGQRRAMSGQMSAVWNLWGTLATFAALILSGFFSDRLEQLPTQSAIRVLFLAAALGFAAVAALGFWKPRAVFAPQSEGPTPRHDLLREMARLLRHRPIYPALIIWLLWNFSPGTSTVLQYYMADTLHASDAQWGAYNAVFSLASVPMFILFGLLSRRFSLRALTWCGAAMGVFQVVPLFFVTTASGMVWAAVLVGVLGGLATPAYMDLLIRSCPRGLEGAMMMTSWSMYALATNFGNLWGTSLFENHGGFVTANIATTIVYALILPVILTVPKRLLAAADEERAA